MPDISVTSYRRAPRSPVRVLIDRPRPTAERAWQIQRAGYRFECQHLADGTAVVAITDGEEDVASETCPDGPDVLAAIDRLIARFTPPRYDRTDAEAEPAVGPPAGAAGA